MKRGGKKTVVKGVKSFVSVEKLCFGGFLPDFA